MIIIALTPLSVSQFVGPYFHLNPTPISLTTHLLIFAYTIHIASIMLNLTAPLHSHHHYPICTSDNNHIGSSIPIWTLVYSCTAPPLVPPCIERYDSLVPTPIHTQLLHPSLHLLISFFFHPPPSPSKTHNSSSRSP
jgi:hypothetical protein